MSNRIAIYLTTLFFVRIHGTAPPWHRLRRGCFFMENEQLVRTEADPGETTYKVIGGTTFEIVTRCVGEKSLMDIVKSAIKRDVESGL